MMNEGDVQVIEPNFEEIQKWILQTVNDDLEDMLAELQGRVWRETEVEEGKFVSGYERDESREQLVNDKGVSRLRGIMKRYITRSSMLGNLSEFQYEQIMISFVTVIVREIHDNKATWDIPDSSEHTVIDTIVDSMGIILTRARNGLDRGLFSNIKMQINRMIQDKDRDKGYVPTPLGGNYGS